MAMLKLTRVRPRTRVWNLRIADKLQEVYASAEPFLIHPMGHDLFVGNEPAGDDDFSSGAASDTPDSTCRA
jgi:hypothetical protein